MALGTTRLIFITRHAHLVIRGPRDCPCVRAGVGACELATELPEGADTAGRLTEQQLLDLIAS
jgi:hypothetical protein